MSSRLQQLYQEMILEHNKNPRHFNEIDDATHITHGKNPLCGDDYYLYIKMDGDTVSDVGFSGSGCAISKSSASMMASAIIGKSHADIREMKDAFLAMLTDEGESITRANLGSLKVFEGVKNYPVRVKCATLIWRALESALEGGGDVSTE